MEPYFPEPDFPIKSGTETGSGSMAARIYFYMHDRYDFQMSRQQERLLMAWDARYPPTEWERERDRRIARVMGHSNPFVTREQTWAIGHKNSALGLKGLPRAIAVPPVRDAEEPADGSIRGNRNSKIFHLPEVCPSYDRVSPGNRVSFNCSCRGDIDGLSEGEKLSGLGKTFACESFRSVRSLTNFG